MNALQVAERSATYALQTAAPSISGEAFNLMATAPQGVAKLRELILALAVQGRLTPNTSRVTGPVDGGPLAEWPVVPLKDVFASIRSGGTPSKQRPEYWDGDIPWASVKDLGFGNPVRETEDSITELGLANGSFLAQKGSILICTRMGLGKIGKAEVDVAINQDLKAVELDARVDPNYFINFFKTLTLKGSGMTVAGIKQAQLLAIRLPLPPLAEQHRIVARVEELMDLCDKLEAHGRLQDEQHAQLVSTLFDALVASASPEELAANWQRVASHFDLLLDRPEAVDALEQTLLQLAVRGLLVPQDPTEEPAPTLLAQTGTQKNRLATPERVKRPNPIRPMDADEQPFEAPFGWTWITFGAVVECLNGYAFKSEWFRPHGTRLVRNVNVSHGHLDWTDTACVDKQRAEEFARFELAEGDMVLTLDRPIISTGLKLAVVRASDLPCLLLQRVAKLTPRAGAVTHRFMLLWLRSAQFLNALDPGRSNGVPHISTRQIGAIPFALPPLAEQHRIVARVEELRGLCADLRQRLQQARTTQSHLANALVTAVTQDRTATPA